MHKQVTVANLSGLSLAFSLETWPCQGQSCDKPVLSRRLAKVHRVMTGPFYQSRQAHTLLPEIDKTLSVTELNLLLLPRLE